MGQINYAPLLPVTPPEGLLEYMISKGAFDSQYLIYRVEYWTDPLTDIKEKCVRVTCTGCGASWLAEYIPCNACRGYAPAAFGFSFPKPGGGVEETISGRHCLCPHCGGESQVVHIGNIPSGIRDNRWCMTVGRLEDKLALSCWLARREIDKDGNQKFGVYPYEAYVVEKKKMVRLTAHRVCLSTDKLLGHWEQRKEMLDKWGIAGEWMPWQASLLEGSTAENSALDLYMGSEYGDCYPVTYLRLWQKYPQLENLLRQGVARPLLEGIGRKMAYNTDYYGRLIGTMPNMDFMNLKEVRPAQMLGLTKDELWHCRAGQWGYTDLLSYQRLKSHGQTTKLPDDMDMIRDFPGWEEIISRLGKRFRLSRCIRYLRRQREREIAPAAKSMITCRYYDDYLGMAIAEGLDITDPHIAFPKSLQKEHDRLARFKSEKEKAAYLERTRKEREARRPAFAARAEALSVYAWEHDDLVIFPPQTEEDLIEESRQLDHCVKTYAESIAEGWSAIFFIRHKDTPEESYFTLELDEKNLTVRQNRGYRNRDRLPDVMAFEKAWLAHIRAAAKKGKIKKTKGAKIA